MASSSTTVINLSLFLLSTQFLIFVSCASSSNLTAYQVLEEYDFPIGLLPAGVLSYSLNSTTGAFEAYLNATCTFSISSYKLKYKSKITGVIATDKLTSLTGIKVKVVWFWLSIVEVVRDGDELEFSVGIASADFPVSNFEECPECGCGFDCDGRSRSSSSSSSADIEKNKLMMKMRFKGLVSSS